MRQTTSTKSSYLLLHASDMTDLGKSPIRITQNAVSSPSADRKVVPGISPSFVRRLRRYHTDSLKFIAVGLRGAPATSDVEAVEEMAEIDCPRRQCGP